MWHSIYFARCFFTFTKIQFWLFRSILFFFVNQNLLYQKKAIGFFKVKIKVHVHIIYTFVTLLHELYVLKRWKPRHILFSSKFCVIWRWLNHDAYWIPVNPIIIHMFSRGHRLSESIWILRIRYKDQCRRYTLSSIRHLCEIVYCFTIPWWDDKNSRNSRTTVGRGIKRWVETKASTSFRNFPYNNFR